MFPFRMLQCSKKMPIVLKKQDKKKKKNKKKKNEGPAIEIPPGVVLPSVVPPPEKEGRYTNHLKYMLYNVMSHLDKLPESIHFKTPVDPVLLQIPTYYTVIKHPMDMSTIRKRIANKYYCDGAECMNDFLQMFTNAIVFNRENTPVKAAAETLQAAFLIKVNQMPLTEIEIPFLTKAQAAAAAAANNLDDSNSDNLRTLRPRNHIESRIKRILAEEDTESDKEDEEAKLPSYGNRQRLSKNLKRLKSKHITKSLRVRLANVKKLLGKRGRVNVKTLTEFDIKKFGLTWMIPQEQPEIIIDATVDKSKPLNYMQQAELVKDLCYSGHDDHYIPLMNHLKENAENPDEKDLMKLVGSLPISTQWDFRDKVIAATSSSKKHGTWSQWFR